MRDGGANVPDMTAFFGAVAAAVAAAPPFWWAGPAATVTAALFAAIFATLATRANRQMVRLRASIDFIERTESQEFYRNVVQTHKA